VNRIRNGEKECDVSQRHFKPARRAEGNVAGVWSPPEAGGTTGSPSPHGHAPRQGRGELVARHICTRFQRPIRGALLMIRQSGGCARVARFTDRLRSDVPPGHYASEGKELRYHRYRSSYSIPLRWRKSKYSS